MSENKCGNCKHWRHPMTGYEPLRRCLSPKVTMRDWDFLGLASVNAAPNDALVISVDGYEIEDAYPLTGPDFGCIHFEAQP